ncbi:MAG: sulfatase [Planctomycetes bacterium]|nr:sulfatase [Planctomycetota bacterium]
MGSSVNLTIERRGTTRMGQVSGRVAERREGAACRGLGTLAKTCARALLPALLPGVVLAACAPSAERHGIEHVILISLDTLRADALGAYVGSGRDRLAEWGAPPAVERAPRLDRLASESVLFERAIAAAPSTLASHTSLLTGLYPTAHGVARNGFGVREELELLAERCAARGFLTAGFIGSFALDRRFGIAQGFAHWDQEFDLLVDGRTHEQNERRAASVTDAVLRWCDATREERAPRFVFAHYFDAHAAYSPPELAPTQLVPAERAAPGEPRRAVTGSLDDLRAAAARHQSEFGGARGLDATILNGLDAAWLGARPVPDALDRALVARYAAEIAYLDREVGRLLDGLRERGLLEHALVIVTADHGETLVDHCDVWNHGLALYQSTIHVPLLVRLPDGAGAGTRVAMPVSNVDVLPTVLALLDLPAGSPVDGVNLVPLLEGAPLARGPVFSTATQPPTVERGVGPWLGRAKAASVIMERHQWIETPYLRAAELYDLVADPEQHENLVDATDPATLAVRDELARRLDAWRDAARPLSSTFDRSQVEEVERRLKELGYTGR